MILRPSLLPLTRPKGGGASLLPLTARIAAGDNSYGAQLGMIDVWQWAWMAAGCRGVPTLGMRQARGGDTLAHLSDRFAPIDAVRSKLLDVMNIQNDISGGDVANTNAGGDLMLARLDAVLVKARAAGNSKIIVPKLAATNAALAKPIANARYAAGVDARAAGAADIIVHDQSLVFDPQNTNQSTDATHPDKSVSSRALGVAKGNLWKAQFVSAGIFDAGAELAGNINPNWNMGTAGTLTNGAGCAAVQTADVLRSDPTIPCRKLAITGTATADPTSVASTGDIRLRFNCNVPAGMNTIATAWALLGMIEVTDSAGNDPQQLATVSMIVGQSTAFDKVYVPSRGTWGAKYLGPIGIAPNLLTVQVTQLSIDLIVRPLQAAGVDIDVRVARLNVFQTDTEVYGPAVNASAIFTTGRPALFLLPTTTPSAGPLAVGGTLAHGGAFARFIGGGVARSYDVIRNGTVDVGDVTPQTFAAAAVPYTIQAGDSGQTLAIRTTGTNGMGTDSVLAPAVPLAVT